MGYLMPKSSLQEKSSGIILQIAGESKTVYIFPRGLFLKEGVMVIVIGNRHGDPWSNPGRGCLCFTFMLMPLGKQWIHEADWAGWVVIHTEFFRVNEETFLRGVKKILNQR